jgi:hypothetical protein
MLRRRKIHADSRLRAALSAAATPLRHLAWVAENRLWSGAALLRGAAEAARWPFERLAWAVERRAVWPLRERVAGFGLPSQVAGGVALGAVAIAAILAGALLSGGNGGSGTERIAPPARVALAPAGAKRATEEASNDPTLQGVPPSFGAGKGGAAAKQDGAPAGAKDEAAAGSTPPEAVEADGAAAAAASAGSDGSTGGEGSAAAASTAKPVPAGREAMKVARRFSEAFVFYEIGKRPARAKTVFGETATPQLAEALAQRPPRLPANAKVPKAKVLNLVPGPRHGGVYTVSVSLLRVGLTSELRISLQHSKPEGWRVTEVLG